MTLFDKSIVDDNNQMQIASAVDRNLVIGPQRPLFFTHLTSDGADTGNYDLNVDGSVTPQRFFIKPPPGAIYRIAKLTLYVQDSGTFDTEKWGNNITMINGIQFTTTRNGVERPILQHPLKTSGNLAELTYDLLHLTFGTGDEFITARWNLFENGQYFRLDGDNGDEFGMWINDDLTGLNVQHFMAHGYIEAPDF